MKYRDLITKMTIEEKVSLLAGKDFWTTHSIERLNIPSMAMADGPHGVRKQAENGDHLGLVEGVKATCFPTSATMANSWNVEICERIGQGLGQEAVASNVNVLLGPGMNIKRNPLCGRNFEYFSEDPYLSGKLAAAYVRGIQSKGVSACPKHFAANNQEYLRMTNDSVVDERTLREIYLTGFEIAVKESNPKTIMSSYNKVNGEYANESEKLLRDTLIDDWGFNGIVVSDWGGSNDHVEGVKNGNHLEMPTTGGDSDYQLLEAIKKGVITESLVDKRVEEYLDVLFSVQIQGEHQVNYEEHHELARKAAEESIVLLKNNDTLPLKSHTKISVIGDFAETPRYQGAGSSLVNSYKLESTIEVISDYELDYIGYVQGYDRIGRADSNKINDAVNLAEKSDVILLYIGLDDVNEVEGYDREHMKIPENQVQLIEALAKLPQPIVIVLSCGAPIDMRWNDRCDAIVHGYLPGQAGAKAILNVMVGKVNPSGKLSESYPYEYKDLSNYNYYPGLEKTSEYREGLYVGYRYFDTNAVDVRYPFGYGLSYTSFEYSDIKIDSNSVRFTILNTGDMQGSEISQLYVGKKSKAIYRPLKELKGFKKVYLEPGESKEVVIEFDDKSFRYFDINTMKFQVEDGDYEIMIGASSRDIRLSGTLYVKGVEVIRDTNISKRYFSGDVQQITNEEFEGLLGHKLPDADWDRTKPLGLNDSLTQMTYAKSRLARLAIKILLTLRKRSFKKGKPNLNILFLTNMPFRAIAKMSGGTVSMEMVGNIVTIVNGHFFKGTSRLIKSWIWLGRRG